MDRIYAAVDLKSYYASWECVARGLDPLKARLVVADESRTDGTICLAVTPALKALGIPGRARLYEVKQRLREIKWKTGEDIDFIIAKPQMSQYLRTSADIYSIYLRYISPDDIHQYSIDEVFIDVAPYLSLYRTDASTFVRKMIQDIYLETGITATGGLGTNLYLAKVAMDILAKKMPADKDGVRMAALTEESYRNRLWTHKPLTDFWYVGPGYARKLEHEFMFCMRDICEVSLFDEEWFYRAFGRNGELLVDHAWGIEPCTMQDIKAYTPASHNLSVGQVLPVPYSFEKARVIIREMAEQLSFDLLANNTFASGLVMDIGYDRETVENGTYHGEVRTDYYGRKVPKHAHGTTRFGVHTSSISRMVGAALELFEKIADKSLTIRRASVVAMDVIPESQRVDQFDMFTDHEAEKREMRIQQAMLKIRQKYGKNAILTGLNFVDGARTIERNSQIGGHRA